MGKLRTVMSVCLHFFLRADCCTAVHKWTDRLILSTLVDKLFARSRERLFNLYVQLICISHKQKETFSLTEVMRPFSFLI